MSALILIAEDERKIAAVLGDYLNAAGMRSVHVGDGAEVLAAVARHAPDLVLLDLMLPHEDGYSLCRALRRDSTVPIIMLTAKVEEIDRLLGLELGADDYICKPFSPREVVARIRALLRRAQGKLTSAPRGLQHGALLLEPTKHLCTLNGEPVSLTPTEFAILKTLMNQPGIPFTRERLIAEALGYDYAGYERTVDVHIRNIRRKIEADAQNPLFIQTVFGIGYRFAEAEPELLGEDAGDA